MEGPVILTEGRWNPQDMIREIVQCGDQPHSFYVMDVGEVVARYRKWKELMPRVEPFYAVKCNNDKFILKTLAALGAGFDCASKGEIEQVMGFGVDSERIIFAHPTKMAAHILFSSEVGVDLMTFDSEQELVKIKSLMSDAKMVIRIRCDAAEAQCPLGDKFGCNALTEAPRLLKIAGALRIDVVGVSFHIGSGTQDFGAYERAIQMARDVFDMAPSLGHTNMKLLDIGGGFPGTRDNSIEKVSSVVNDALSKYFPEQDIRVIAEPGRYFADAAYTLAVQVFAKREIIKEDNQKTENETMYFINDGIYGSFADIVFVHKQVNVEPLNPSKGKKVHKCSIWGPSADAIDCVVPSTMLPSLSVGDWLYVRDMGAYSLAIATTFNGFPLPRVLAVVDRNTWSILQDACPKIGDFLKANDHQQREISLKSSKALAPQLSNSVYGSLIHLIEKNI